MATPAGGDESLRLWRMLPYGDNRVTLNHDKKDKWGRPLIAVNCEFKENERTMNKDISKTAGELLDAGGFKNIAVRNTMSFPAMPITKWHGAHGPRPEDVRVKRLQPDARSKKCSSRWVVHDFQRLRESLPHLHGADGTACDYAVKQMKRMEI